MSCTIMNYAMNYLTQKSNSEHFLYLELMDKFAHKPCQELKIEHTVTHLKKIGLVNDERFAQNIAHRYSNKGDKAITHYLQQRGISALAIQKTLKAMEPECQRALKVIDEIQSSWYNKNSQEQQFLIMRVLSSRSFSYKTVNRIIAILHPD